MKKTLLATAILLSLSSNALAAWHSLSDNQATDGVYKDGIYLIDQASFSNIQEKADGDLYLGSGKSSDLVPDSTMTIDVGDNQNWEVDVFGGGWAQSANGEQAGSDVIRNSGNVTINLDSGTINGTVFAGGNAMSGSENYSGEYRTVTGNVSLNVNGATVSEAVVGGAKIRANVNGGHASSSVGNVTINMNSGKVAGIVGGNLINSLGATEGLKVEGTVKDISINVNGGTVGKLANATEGSSVSILNTAFDAAIVGGNVSSFYNGNDYNHERIASAGTISINIAKSSTVDGSIIAGSVISGNNAGTDSSRVSKATVDVSGKVNGNVIVGGALVSGSETASAPVTQDASIILRDGAEVGTVVAGDLVVVGDTASFIANETKKSITIDSQNVSIAAIDTLGDKAGKNVSIVGTDSFNDSFQNVEAAVAWMQDIEGLTEKDGQAFSIEAGLVNDAATVTENGVQYHKNSLMQNALDLAVTTPIQITRILTNDVRKRLGDLRSTENTHGVWARYDGGKLSGDDDFDVKFNTVQIGIDTVPTPDSARFGVAFSYTNGDAEFGRGDSDLEAYSLAAYGTWMADNGLFVDVIGRLATVDSDLKVNSNIKGKMDNLALSLSGEFGWRFDVNNMFYLEPQAEATYTYVDSESFKLSNATYELDSSDSLVGRLGFSAGMKCPQAMGDAYIRASVVHEFLGDAEISARNGIASNVASIDGKDTWFEFGLGANFNVNEKTYIYADVERTQGADLETDWRANVGVRYSF